MIKKSRLFYIAGGVALLFLFLAPLALAAVDVGTNEINSAIELGSESPLRIAARIVNIFMMFLGVIAVGLVIFAGFKWMTSNGNEEQISTAKKILRNALIGLGIILASWGIVTFIFNRLLGATGNGGNNLGGGGPKGGALGFGAIGSCVINSVYPEIDQKDVARNTSIIVTFKEPLDLSSVCVDGNGGECVCNNTNSCNIPNPERIKVYPTDAGPESSASDLMIMAPDDLTLIIVPKTPLGSPTANTWYTTSLTNDLKKADGRQLFDTCSTDYFRWQFEVSNRLDLTPPQVKSGGVFPAPDNARDQASTSTNWAFATGHIRVKQQPQVYAPASIVSVAKNGDGNYSNAKAVAENGYNGSATTFVVTVVGTGAVRAQLSSGGNSLGMADFVGKDVNFPGYFTLTLDTEDDKDPGNSWIITVSPEKIADTITIAGDTYTFISGNSNGFNIKSVAGLPQQASSTQAAISGSAVEPTININNPSRIDLRARNAGTVGNDIVVDTNNTQTFEIGSMSGGANQQVTFTVNEPADKPMNSVIQINFDEALNPMSVSGTADQLKDSLRVVNAQAGSLANGATCISDNACLSFKCESSKCVGNYLDGTFKVSNGYKTVEFKSKRECGMNGCGEKIYCLPANSNVKVEIMAADLGTCDTDVDCAAKAPYSTCVNNTFLGHKTCQDSGNHNYPAAVSPTASGIMDAAMNSFDGNRDTYADGPIVVGGVKYFYDQNNPNAAYKDNYRWSFYINNQVATDPPKISSITPAINGTSTSLTDPVTIDFGSLLMNSSLRSGVEGIQMGTTTIEHHFFGLTTKDGPAPGYWITGDNIDNSPQDGEMDYTKVRINHVMLAEAVGYNSQAGSGVRDIYQNCFKPSASATCSATQLAPSCCNGTTTSALDDDGNCIIN